MFGGLGSFFLPLVFPLLAPAVCYSLSCFLLVVAFLAAQWCSPHQCLLIQTAFLWCCLGRKRQGGTGREKQRKGTALLHRTGLKATVTLDSHASLSAGLTDGVWKHTDLPEWQVLLQPGNRTERHLRSTARRATLCQYFERMLAGVPCHPPALRRQPSLTPAR